MCPRREHRDILYMVLKTDLNVPNEHLLVQRGIQISLCSLGVLRASFDCTVPSE